MAYETEYSASCDAHPAESLFQARSSLRKQRTAHLPELPDFLPEQIDRDLQILTAAVDAEKGICASVIELFMQSDFIRC